ncbi:unnamed protein product [Vicia faba]|uniref:F-box domain-containing protein n=1 Tax=Vicia faba TaxID=3906 RepID=A0AAV1B6M5_VICFA|nr:unnamed protein product [Vicia faba]
MAWIRTKFGRTRVSGDQNQDRLSDLPECIILHILSFLSIQHAVQTCVLSTRWKHLWKRIPTIRLNSFQFRTLKIFSVFLSKILSLRDTSTAPHTFDLFRHRDIEPRLLKKFLNYVFYYNTHLKHLGISVNGDTALILSCVSSCRALTSLKLSLHPRGRDPTETLFPNSLNLPLLTSLDLTNFAFCGDESGCADPFLAFTKLNTLVLRCCKVMDAQILSISSHTLVNFAMHHNSSLLAKIKLYVPTLSTFNYTGNHHIHEICGSGLSSVKKVNIKSRRFSASMEDALILFSWLLNFANIESLTVTSTILQILSLNPDLFEVKLHSLHKLKSLKVKLIQIEEGSLLLLMEDAMLKKAAAKSPKEVEKLREAFETCLEPPAIPDGIVDFLRQNSPSAEVNIRTKYPSSFNLKQIEESIKGVKINDYRSRFSVPSTSKLPRLSLRSSSSVAPASADKSASEAAPASATEPAKTLTPEGEQRSASGVVPTPELASEDVLESSEDESDPEDSEDESEEDSGNGSDSDPDADDDPESGGDNSSGRENSEGGNSESSSYGATSEQTQRPQRIRQKPRSKPSFDRAFSHFVRVLVELDLTKELIYKVLVERVGFAFFVEVEYEKIPDFCTFCNCIGHGYDNCKRKSLKDMNNGKSKTTEGQPKTENKKEVEVVDIDDNTQVNEPKDQEEFANTSDGRNQEEEILEANENNHIVTVNQEADKEISESDSEAEFVDATLEVLRVEETQPNLQGNDSNIQIFLSESWANMAAQEVNLETDGFKLVSSKRNSKKSKKKQLTRAEPSTSNPFSKD